MSRVAVVVIALIACAGQVRAEGPQAPPEDAPVAVDPAVRAPGPQSDDGEAPPPLRAPPPAQSPPFMPPRVRVPEAPPPHRGTGIALMVLGNVMQVVGVGFLAAGVMNQGGSASNRVPTYYGVGGGLDGLGNVVEAVGWTLMYWRPRGERGVERARLAP